jgi:hypothetical protein
MRRALVLGVVGCLASPSLARANDFFADGAMVEHTRQVSGDHARTARNGRMFGGVSLALIGTGTAAMGYHVYASAKSGGFVDFSGLQRGVGVGLMAVGGFALLAAPFALLVRTDQERIHDGLERAVARGEGTEAAVNLRGEISRRAAAGRRVRRTVRGIGYTFAGTGAIAFTAGLVGDDYFQRDTRNLLLGAGVAALAGGAGFVVGSLFETDHEKYERDLAQPRIVGGGLVPVRGGALAGLSLTF